MQESRVGEQTNDDVLRTNWADRSAYILLAVFVFLAPVFFVPSLLLPLLSAKVALVVGGFTFTFLLFTIGRLKEGVLALPKHWLALSASAWGLVLFVCALFSPSLSTSFLGTTAESDTFIFLFAVLGYFFLVPAVASSRDRLFGLLLACLAGTSLSMFLEVLRFVLPQGALSFGFFSNETLTSVGLGGDASLLAGFTVLVGVILLELCGKSTFVRFLSGVSTVLSLAVLIIRPLPVAWIILAVSSLLFLVYAIFLKRGLVASGGTFIRPTFPVYALVLFVIALVGSMWGTFLGTRLFHLLDRTPFGTQSSPITLQTTWTIAEEVLRTEPLFGAGLNRFESSWFLHKPAYVNKTELWNSGVRTGSGFIPTLLVTTGVVGFVLALAFLGLLLWYGGSLLFADVPSPRNRLLASATTFGSLFLWIAACAYPLGPVLLFMTFMTSGVLVAVLYEAHILQRSSLSFAANPRAGFVAATGLIVLFLIVASFLYVLGKAHLAHAYFVRSVMAFEKNAKDTYAFSLLERSSALSYSGQYPAILSEAFLSRLNLLLGEKRDFTQKEAQEELRDLVERAIKSAELAVDRDPTNYEHWLVLGRVYEAVLPLGVEGAYDHARTSYEQALALHPASPALLFTQARLEFANKNMTASQAYVEKALASRPNYTEALFLKAQIAIAEGKIDDAISGVEATLRLAPHDFGLFYQLGLLHYSKESWEKAGAALRESLRINPAYADAKYFLGLTFYRLGRTPDALRLFEEVLADNPENKDVEAIVLNLRAGNDPFFKREEATPPSKR